MGGQDMQIRHQEIYSAAYRRAHEAACSIMVLIFVAILLGTVGYLCVEYFIPAISKVLCDFMSFNIDLLP